MTGVLRKLGIPAVTTEHNDILVETIGDGRQATGRYKISGNACYALPTGTIVHGTLLYDVDFDALQQAITPDHEKLAKHGVNSVRQRVMNIKPILDGCFEGQGIEELKIRLSQLLCNGSRVLTSNDIENIKNKSLLYKEKMPICTISDKIAI